MVMTYTRASTLAEALEASDHGAMVLAGGTDLVSMRQTGAVRSDRIVDIKSLADLRAISLAPLGDVAVIGAAVTMSGLRRANLPSWSAALADGASVVGAPQTRARATLGGNICRASPAGDTLPALLALGATAQVTSLGGSRHVPLREFFVGPGRTVMVPGEILTAVQIDCAVTGSAYRRLTYRSSLDLAVVGVAVAVKIEKGACTAATIALGGVGPTPMVVPKAAEILVGSASDPEALSEAGHVAATMCRAISDVRASEQYRRHAVAVLVARVAHEALMSGGLSNG